MSSLLVRSTLLSFGLGLALLYVLTIALQSPVQAQTATALLSNFGQTSTAEDLYTDKAQPFRTGANTGGYVLTSIEINTNFQPGGNVSYLPTLKVHSGSATGTEVAALTAPGSITSSNLMYTALANTTLTASTTYWVVSTGGQFANWLQAGSTTLDSGAAAGWSIPGKAQFKDGTTYSDAPGSVYFKIRVNGYARTATAVTVEFEESAYTVAESDDSETMDVTENEVEVTVTLSADPGRTVIIPITKTNEGGASNSDYSGVPASVTFDSGETEQTFTFTATADTADDDEDKVKLGFGTLPAGVTAGTTAETTVSITDDDYPNITVSFGAATYSVDEGFSVTIDVTLSANPERDILIPLTRTFLGTSSADDLDSESPTTVQFNDDDDKRLSVSEPKMTQSQTTGRASGWASGTCPSA